MVVHKVRTPTVEPITLIPYFGGVGLDSSWLSFLERRLKGWSMSIPFFGLFRKHSIWNPSGIFLELMSRASGGIGTRQSYTCQVLSELSRGGLLETLNPMRLVSTDTLTKLSLYFCFTWSITCLIHSLRMMGYGVEQFTLHSSEYPYR